MLVSGREDYIDMGRNPTGERKYAIESIWDSHREVLRLAVTGMKSVDIARALNVTEAMVSYTLNSPVAKREMELLRSSRDLDALDVAKRIQQVAPVALQVMEELLAQGNENTKYKAATDILDRAGHAAVKTLRTENLSVHLTHDDIEEIKSRAKEIGLCTSDDVIDIEEASA